MTWTKYWLSSSCELGWTKYMCHQSLFKLPISNRVFIPPLKHNFKTPRVDFKILRVNSTLKLTKLNSINSSKVTDLTINSQSQVIKVIKIYYFYLRGHGSCTEPVLLQRLKKERCRKPPLSHSEDQEQFIAIEEIPGRNSR